MQIKKDIDYLSDLQLKSDDYADSVYNFINNKLKDNALAVDERSIWNGYMAIFLNDYYQRYQWKLRARTDLIDCDSCDFATWSLPKIKSEMLKHILQSIDKEVELQKMKIEPYLELMFDYEEDKQNMDSFICYRPTLFDALAHSALDVLRKGAWNESANDEIIISYFSENEKFIVLDANTMDSTSIQFLVFRIYQKLTKAHLREVNPMALIDVTLHRFEYANGILPIKSCHKNQLQALLSLEKKYKGQPGYEDVCLALGRFYSQRATLYSASTFPEFQYDYVTAQEWYEKTRQVAPNSVAAQQAEYASRSLKRPEISLDMLAPRPMAENLFSIKVTNCDSLCFRVIDLSADKYEELYRQCHYNMSMLYGKLLRYKALKEWSLPVACPKDYREHTAEAVLPALPPGNYTVLVSSCGFSEKNMSGFMKESFRVSNVGFMQRYASSCDSFDEFLLYDRTTGEPIVNQQVNVSSKNPVSQKSYTTDKNGIFRIPRSKSYYNVVLSGKYGNDEFSKSFYLSGSYNEEKTLSEAKIFTDRGIYRPGQTVYFKIIADEHDAHSIRTIANQKLLVKLYDANYQKINEIELVTNEFGSVNGSFEIPETALTGNFSIQVNGGGRFYCEKAFRVEEYKRPQFEVQLESPTDHYRLNDSVTVKGTARAYAGYPIEGAKIAYKVMLRFKFPRWRWFLMPAVSHTLIASGTATSSADGSFSFDFLAEKLSTIASENVVYQYVVSVDVTDVNGETHSTSRTISIGEKSLVLEMDLPEIITKEEDKVELPISAHNLEGIAVAANISYHIDALTLPGKWKHTCESDKADFMVMDSALLRNTFSYIDFDDESNRLNWPIEKTVTSGNVQSSSSSSIVLDNLKMFSDGAYRITANTIDDYGDTIEYVDFFYIQDVKSKRSSIYSAVSLYADKDVAQPGETVTVSIGSYLESATTYLEVICNDEVIHSQWLVLLQGQTQCQIPITESMRGEVRVSAFLCDNGFSYQKNLTVKVPFTNKKIDFEWVSFRDKTQPGSNETLQLKLKGNDGDKLAAELLCSMYDASLDAYQSNDYFFDKDYLWCQPKKNFNLIKPNLYSDFFLLNYSSGHYVEKRYYEFDSHFLSVAGNYGKSMFFARSGAIAKSANGEAAAINGVMATYEQEEVADLSEDSRFDRDATTMETISTSADKGAGADNQEQESQVRSDFAETAFFYPQLRPDDEGNVLIQFKMPESLTKWKLLGLAHTVDLSLGTFEKIIQTEKPLMVVPNIPRFLRENDTILLSTKIVNLSDSALSGTLSLQFFDAQTQKPVNIVQSAEVKDFTVEKNGTALLMFTVTVPQNISALTYRLVARAEQKNGTAFSDGESATIPVLPNRMLVTESLNLYVNGGGSKSFSFKPLNNFLLGKSPKSRSHCNLKLELTPNPMWYAVQALPYLTEYPFDCNEQIFSKIYANSLAATIANSSPEIRLAFQSWCEGDSLELQSPLAKNQELKTVLLEETPWVMESQNESAHKQQLARLFDLKRIEKENQSLIKKLQK
ncbi:MAG: MG2 domain-containing protein, partial [Bacteroidales bacterium]|nr:MG2 domain-containing protein [Bacteroidales bacterium]